jgi:hypothetical protein
MKRRRTVGWVARSKTQQTHQYPRDVGLSPDGEATPTFFCLVRFHGRETKAGAHPQPNLREKICPSISFCPSIRSIVGANR